MSTLLSWPAQRERERERWSSDPITAHHSLPTKRPGRILFESRRHNDGQVCGRTPQCRPYTCCHSAIAGQHYRIRCRSHRHSCTPFVIIMQRCHHTRAVIRRSLCIRRQCGAIPAIVGYFNDSAYGQRCPLANHVMNGGQLAQYYGCGGVQLQPSWPLGNYWLRCTLRYAICMQRNTSLNIKGIVEAIVQTFPQPSASHWYPLRM